MLSSKDKLNEELPQPQRNLQAIVDFEETKDIKKNMQKLIVSLKEISSFTFDYNYNILPAKRHIPYTPNSDFVGRNEDLVGLYLEMIGGVNKLNYQQVGLVGMPGVGKTQLAVEFAYRYAYQFEKGVYWIQGLDPTTWLKQLVDIAKQLELEIDNLQESNDSTNCTNNTNKTQNSHMDAKDQDKKYFFELKNYCNKFGNQMLIIIDNVNEPNSLNEDDILFPNDPSASYNLLNLGCNILFTTRKNFELSAAGVIPHHLKVLLAPYSYDLLTKYRKPSSEQEEECARTICNRVGYLPLALVLVQAVFLKYKTDIRLSFKHYDDELAKNGLYPIDIGKIKNGQLATQHKAAVRATFDEIWNILETKDPEHVQEN
jgi:hypothetical protein